MNRHRSEYGKAPLPAPTTLALITFGAVVDLEWRDGAIQSSTFRALVDGTHHVVYGDTRRTLGMKAGDVIRTGPATPTRE